METLDLPSSIDGGIVAARFGDAVALPSTINVALPMAASAERSEVQRLPVHGHFEDPSAVLTAALSRRREVAEEVAALTATIGRLAPLIDAQGVAAAALTDFDAGETELLRAWAAEASDTLPPAPRTELRAELTAALETAEQRANAARAATKAAEARIAEANASLGPADLAIAAASAMLLPDKAADIIDRAADCVDQLERAVAELGGLELVLQDECDRARNSRNPATTAVVARLVRFQEAIRFLGPFLASMRIAFPGRRPHWEAELANIVLEYEHANN